MNIIIQYIDKLPKIREHGKNPNPSPASPQTNQQPSNIIPQLGCVQSQLQVSNCSHQNKEHVLAEDMQMFEQRGYWG